MAASSSTRGFRDPGTGWLSGPGGQTVQTLAAGDGRACRRTQGAQCPLPVLGNAQLSAALGIRVGALNEELGEP